MAFKLTAGALFLLVIFGLGFHFLRPKVPAATAQQMSEPEREARAKLSKYFPGKLLFDSNRSGTFGIYVTSIDGEDLETIVDTEVHEVYPDASPDGKLIVYARTESLKRGAPATIWLVNRDGSNPRQISEDGTFPSFSADGKSIYFERRRIKVMQIDLDGQNEREIYPNGDAEFGKYKYYVVKPRISQDGRYVYFTSDNRGRWNAFYGDMQTKTSHHVHWGCEPVPFADGVNVAWINKAHMLAKSGIKRFNKQSGNIDVIRDGGPPMGHEYFPTLVENDKFLLYSACSAHLHSHETADYQLYVKDMQSGESTRITFDNHTNRWPKLIK